jgi:hypothetical protein
MNEVNRNSVNVTEFCAVYELTSSKVLEVSLSLINILLVTPWIIFIIWYQCYKTFYSWKIRIDVIS